MGTIKRPFQALASMHIIWEQNERYKSLLDYRTATTRNSPRTTCHLSLLKESTIDFPPPASTPRHDSLIQISLAGNVGTHAYKANRWVSRCKMGSGMIKVKPCPRCNSQLDLRQKSLLHYELHLAGKKKVWKSVAAPAVLKARGCPSKPFGVLQANHQVYRRRSHVYLMLFPCLCFLALNPLLLCFVVEKPREVLWIFISGK